MACGVSQMSAVSPTGLELSTIDRLSHELYKSVKKDHLVRAKFILKGLCKADRKKIVSRTFDGNAPLFIAAQQGQLHFVNYLLDECFADIEQKGVYEVVEDRSRHKVTPLWCSAVANKVEVVKSLLRHGANVNACSDTNSTPVRSACYMTNLDVVKVLVEHGADINMANVNGGTCLINSVQSPELCKYLIERGTSVNAQDNSGNLALHYAIREGRLETVRLLLKHKSDPYVTNDFGDDAIQTASLRGYSEILEFLLGHPSVKPVPKRTIEAYELMGTNYVDEKHDIQRALTIWKTAMEMRYSNPDDVIEKPVGVAPNPAYMGIVEARNMVELEEIATNPDAVYMQALLIRERILGPDHKDTVFGLMYRGAVYADTHRYQRCVDLWKYAFKLRHLKQDLLNPECIFTLQALCKLFWEIHEEFTAEYTQENVHFSDVCEVLDMAVTEIVNKPMDSNDSLNTIDIPVTSQSMVDSTVQVTGEEKHTMLLLVLHLIHLVSKIAVDKEQKQRLCIAVHKLIRTKACGINGRSLLHLAVDNKISVVAEEFYSDFPSVEVSKLLVQCGCDVNGLDTERNTVLHVIGEGLTASPVTPKCRLALEEITQYLIDKGAHVDAANAKGINAGTVLQEHCRNVRLFDFVTLKCLAARVIKKENINYQGEIPVTLFPFVDLH